MIYERMRWYHQIGCTSCGCCRSQPDADDKTKELLSFLALVNLGAVWDRDGCGTLLKLDVLVTLLKETLSSEMRLQWFHTALEVCKGGLTWGWLCLADSKAWGWLPLEEVLCHMNLAIKSLLAWELFILNFGGASHGEFQGEAFPSSVLPFRFYLCIN